MYLSRLVASSLAYLKRVVEGRVNVDLYSSAAVIFLHVLVVQMYFSWSESVTLKSRPRSSWWRRAFDEGLLSVTVLDLLFYFSAQVIKKLRKNIRKYFNYLIFLIFLLRNFISKKNCIIDRYICKFVGNFKFFSANNFTKENLQVFHAQFY